MTESATQTQRRPKQRHRHASTYKMIDDFKVGTSSGGTVSKKKKKKKKTSSKLNAADSFLHSFVSSMDFTRLFLSSGNRFYLVFRSTGDTDCLAWRRPAEGKK